MSPAAVKPTSKNLDHHFSVETKARGPSGMKAMAKLLFQPGMTSLAGGMPHASLFPMKSASFEIPDRKLLTGSADAWKNLSASTPTQTVHLAKAFEGDDEDLHGVVDLSEVMQYGMLDGFDSLVKPLNEIMQLVHSPPCSDTTVGLTLGCTDGVSKTFLAFQEQGPGTADVVLAEEFSFSSSLSSGRCKGISFWPVAMDHDGLIPEELERVISTWDEKTQGKKPHSIYLIPCGQNPTGTVPPEERYEAIYKICQKHDLVIFEDDPYFWLQYQDYTTDLAKRQAQIDAFALPPVPETAEEEDMAVLMQKFNGFAGRRSFLSRDIDGRVIRLDTFSKMFAPGMRMGWVTANASFIERYTRIGETTTQAVNGMGQAVVASYLDPKKGWGTSGFLRWIYGVRLDYQSKRDFFVDNLSKYVDAKYATTTPALGGMFQWLEIHVSKHPRFVRKDPAPVDAPATNTVELIAELFTVLLKVKLLVIPGVSFSVATPEGTPNGPTGHIHDKCNFLRTTFAGEKKDIETAMIKLGPALKAWFEDSPSPAADETTA